MRNIKLASVHRVFVARLLSVVLAVSLAFSAASVFAQTQNPTTYTPGGGSSVDQNAVTYGGNAALAPSGPLTTISGVLNRIETIINLVIPFLIGLAVFIIIYGILGYISNAADEERRKEARDFIMWGVIGIFFMLSIWGLVTILVNTFPTAGSSDIVNQTYNPGNTVTAPTSAAPTDLIQFINRMQAIGTIAIIPFLFAIAIFIILLGIVNYIRQGDNEEKRAEARAFVIWGVISIFIMLSIWGFVSILVNSFKVTNTIPTIPILPTLTP